VSTAELLRLTRIEARMNTAKHDECSTVARHSSHIESSQCVGGVDADPNHIAWLNALGTNGLKSLINNNGSPVLRRSSGSKHVQPPRGDHANTEGDITRVD
jgi:hypothetical protein